jgi:DNA helicase-2/ATP-dependent DNA helicase PcrA
MDETEQFLRIHRKSFWVKAAAVGDFKDIDSAISAINIYFGQHSQSRYKATIELRKFFNRLSEEIIEPKNCSTSDATLKSLLKIYSFYLQELESDLSTDLSLMQKNALLILAANPASSSVFKHVIVDEYQDTNYVQEQIFFALAKGHKNLCVVGDDDQSLYRFRGAVVENFVDFPARCVKNLGVSPKGINLSINYRSLSPIVKCYSDFIKTVDWKREDGKGYYRIANKKLEAFRKSTVNVVATTENVDIPKACAELALLTETLKKTGRIQDYNQIAFLFPTLHSDKVKEMRKALEARKIEVYAPRAGRFLEVDEAQYVFGLFLKIFGKPTFADDMVGADAYDFNSWLKNSLEKADTLQKSDPNLAEFIKDRKQEIELSQKDYDILAEIIKKQKWDIKADYSLDMGRVFTNSPTLSTKAKKSISSRAFSGRVTRRKAEGRPYTLRYTMRRATTLDWNMLDLFYQLLGFDAFRKMLQLAEGGKDEGPICNLGLITQYLAKYSDHYGAMISGEHLKNEKFLNAFFISYCYSLFRLQESEYEDAEDPFPKGRVPFLTIHQAKGLEFPVVVLGSLLRRKFKEAPKIEQIVRALTNKGGEPLGKISHFDNMRLFYVALSRAQNLLVLANYKSKGATKTEEFKTLLSETPFTVTRQLSLAKIPKAGCNSEDLGKSYSYTSDYLLYKKCPRNYMLFRKYGFVSSRSPTMSFGSLVHRTIEDLHSHLLSVKEPANV